MTRIGWRRAGAGVWAVGMLLAGCADAGSDPAADPTATADPTPTSPLAEILGWGMATGGTGPAPAVSELERRRHRRVEQLIAECMDGHGFEYVPVPLEQRRAGPFDEAYALEPADFAAQYGYGVTTLSASASDDSFQDPNQQIADSLAPDERERYQRALWGEPDAAGSDAAGPDAGSGCRTRAEVEVYGRADPDDRQQQMERFEDLFAALDELWQRIEHDPRLADTDANWSACMAESGYPDFARPHDARQSVFDRHAQLSARSDPDPAALATLRDYELALAPVDHACRQEHVDGPRREVAYELEARFVERHRAELEAYRDWVSGQGPA